MRWGRLGKDGSDLGWCVMGEKGWSGVRWDGASLYMHGCVMDFPTTLAL